MAYTKSQLEILAQATRILQTSAEKGEVLDDPSATAKYLALKLYSLEHELFVAVFVDQRHRQLAYCELFRGTIDGASVHPREIVKEALACNAAGAIIAHNHPSGDPEPSGHDLSVTRRIRDALDLVSVRLIDHIIIGEAATYVSCRERGII